VDLQDQVDLQGQQGHHNRRVEESSHLGWLLVVGHTHYGTPRRLRCFSYLVTIVEALFPRGTLLALRQLF
jgi:hypothetical protein